jgi:16S rRNA processing protein RimM
LDDYYLIAEIQDHFKENGSVIIKSFSDFPERFFVLKKIFIEFFGKPKELDIEYAQKLENSIIVKFRRFESEADSLFLIGKKIYISKENLATLPDDTYYIHDLVGCQVFIDFEFFGKLIDVLRLPNNDIYLVQKENGDEIMIPAVERFVKNIDKVNKKVILDSECKIFDENEN